MGKVTDYLQSAQKTLFSFEIIPPSKGEGIKKLFDHIQPLLEFGPKFIDVTYHREENIDKILPGGLLERKTVRKRPGTVGICAAIMNHFKVETVPHIICGGFSREETENALIDLNFLGIENILAIRGDCTNGETYFHPHPQGHSYASDLLSQVKNLARGNYLDEDLKGEPLNFCTGVAGYPEKHYESPNLDIDLTYLKKKVDLGADYIVTQMFFDNQKYFDFVKRCRSAGITVPIVPGLKPITSKRQLTLLPHRFHIDIPLELSQSIEKAPDNEAVKQIGVEWAIMQSRELIRAQAPCLHYYSMGKSTSVYQTAKAVF